MSNLFVPTGSAEDWTQSLAQQDRQPHKSCYAKSVAKSWEGAQPHLPREIKGCLDAADDECVGDLELIFAISEYRALLPGANHQGSSDVFALCSNEAGLVPVIVEGKASEPLGLTKEQYLSTCSVEAKENLYNLLCSLKLTEDIPGSIRCHLVYWAASALMMANKFNAQTAAMVVHSFDSSEQCFEDYRAFVSLFKRDATLNSSVSLGLFGQVELFAGWAQGES